MGHKPTNGYRSLQVLSNGTELVDKSSESAILAFAIQSKDSDANVGTKTFLQNHTVCTIQMVIQFINHP